MEITKEDVLTLRLEIAELRREMAELRREIAARAAAPVDGGEYKADDGDPEVSNEQIMTEWTEGEEAWKNMQK